MGNVEGSAGVPPVESGIDRRKFIMCGALTFGLLGAAGHNRAEAGESSIALRTITYNVCGCRGWPRRRTAKARLEAARDQMPVRLALELALYEPDIVTLSEAPSEKEVARIAGHLDMGYVFYPSPEGFPGALMTRYKIVSSANCPLPNGRKRPGELFTRHFGRAVLDTSLGDVVVYSAHLNPHKTDTRLREIAMATAAMRHDMKTGGSIILQGDLNHTPDGPEYQRWADAGFVDAFDAAGSGSAGTSNSIKPRVRVDYIWSTGSIAKQLVSCRVLFEGSFRFDSDDPVHFALSDHLPVMASFERDAV